MFTTIDEQRAFGSRLLVGILWLMTAVITATALLLKAPWLGYGGAAAGVSLAATAAWRLDPLGASSRLAVAVALMAQVSLLVAVQTGKPWQIDMHMAYFAALAVLVIYCDWQVILAGAAVVAVHHLTLSFLAAGSGLSGIGEPGAGAGPRGDPDRRGRRPDVGGAEHHRDVQGFRRRRQPR